MVKRNKQRRRQEPASDNAPAPPLTSKQWHKHDADPPRPNRVLLIVSGVLLAAWFLFLLKIAIFG